MPSHNLSDTLIYDLGPAIAKFILAICLRDVGLAANGGTDLVDFLHNKTSNARLKQKTSRLFEEIGEQVAESFIPIFKFEAPGIDQSSCNAVTLALVDTLRKANLDAATLAVVSLDPYELTKYLLKCNPNVTLHFEDALIELFNRMLQQCSYSIINVASTLPNFSEQTFSELFKRIDKIYEAINKVIEEINHIQEDVKRLNKNPDHARFERDYSNFIVNKLGKLDLFGIDVSASSQRYGLDTAYTTLRASWISGKSVLVGSRSNPITRVLSESRRIFIRGEAGSGKTTLLQWIAVRAATRTFPLEIADWDGAIPFFIRLRQFSKGSLPTPKEFIQLLTPLLSDRVTDSWLNEILESGRSIFLIDGLDELSSYKQKEVLSWLSDIITLYPQARFILTARPYALNQNWLNREDFDNVELERMDLPIIAEFIDRWHKAVFEELTDHVEKDELEKCRISVHNAVNHDRSIRALATNPLLCAVLCALNRQRHRDLPSQRIYLYEAACRMLLEAREKRSEISLEHYLPIEYDELLLILQEIAYWMFTNSYKQVEKSEILRQIENVRHSMPRMNPQIKNELIYQLLVQRSGIVREPQEDILDFIHLTFQEYLTAKCAIEKSNIGLLISFAHNPQWHEVIILAAALAGEAGRSRLISGIRTKGDKSSKEKIMLYLEAISCANVAVKLPPDLSESIRKLAESLPSPKNKSEAQAWAEAGQLAISFLNTDYLLEKERENRYIQLRKEAIRDKKIDVNLVKKPNLTINDIDEKISASCVYALGLIAGDAALEAIEGFTSDIRHNVGKEIGLNWRSFPRNIYLSRILSHCSTLAIKQLPSYKEFDQLRSLISLEIVDCDNLSDLDCLANLDNLITLEVIGCENFKEIKGIQYLKKLKMVRFRYCPEIKDLKLLCDLPNLQEIELYQCPGISTLADLAKIKPLRTVKYGGWAPHLVKLQKRMDIAVFRLDESHLSLSKPPRDIIVDLPRKN